jgi:hypothetical protein
LRITASGNIKPFVRRMVRFIDSLRTGRPVRVARVARRSANHDLLTLVSAISRAVEEERLSAAYFTAFLAAHYAYQNSLDYLCALKATWTTSDGSERVRRREHSTRLTVSARLT